MAPILELSRWRRMNINRQHKLTLKRSFHWLLAMMLSAFVGALILSAFSVFQKNLIDVPLVPKGFIVPSLFGGLFGIAFYIWKKRFQKDTYIIKDREALLSLVSEAANEGIWDWNLETGEVGFDERYYTMAGYEPYEFPCHFDSWRDRVHPDDIGGASQAIDNYVKGRNDKFVVEFRFLKKNGTWMWVQGTGKIVSWQKNGTPIRFIGVHIDINERKAAEEKVKSTLAEKETLLKEIHHRVKNNLNVVAGLLHLQEVNCVHIETKRVLNDNINRINAMAGIHEALYSSENLADVDLRSYIERIVSSFKQTFSLDSRNITFEVEAEEITITIEKASPLGLAINELITNAIKYAFLGREAGTIYLKLYLKESKLLVEINDDGVGLPDGFDWRAQTTLGLNLVHRLIEKQLNGRVTMKNNNGLNVFLELEHEKAPAQSEHS